MKRPILAVLGAVALASCTPRQQPSNDTVFISNEGSNRVTVLDGATGQIDGHFATGARPRGLALSADGRTLYVATMCPPYPFQFDASGSDPICPAALAAFGRDDTCNVDGKTSTHPIQDAAAE